MSDPGFRYTLRKTGAVVIDRHGRRATVLRGHLAQLFFKAVQSASEEGQQKAMARVTGNYKRGNEKGAKR